jgi:hypothetical protein
VARPDKRVAPKTKRRSLNVEVVWGDVTRVDANVYAVGHYQGVLPQNAEAAFDEAVSAPTSDPQRRVITALTRSGVIRGALGDVFFVPWRAASVAVAGMGRPGTFRERQLRVLWRCVAQTTGRLVREPVIGTVLIGSGAGTLSVPEAVSGMFEGIAEAFDADTDLKLSTIKIVERDLDRAVEALKIAKELAAPDDTRRKSSLGLTVKPELQEADGGTIPDRFCYSVLSAAVARAGHDRTTTLRDALRPVLSHIADEKLRDRVAEGLRDLSVDTRESLADLRQTALHYRLREPQSSGASPIPTRISFSVQQNRIHTAAITHTVTVAERTLGMKASLIARAVEQMIDPDDARLQQYGRALSRFLIHADFKSHIDSELGHLVLEVDRQMAAIPWEMLHEGAGTEPLGIRRPLARQLRTTYSPRPPEAVPRATPRALVIGDPADGQRVLPESRVEAQEVAKVLTGCGFDVVLRIGAPEDGTGAGPIKGVPPADLLEIVDLLASGEFDLVHYSGHADVNDQYPDQTGWLFKGGEFLTPGELEALDQPPAIVVANACSSGVLGRNPALVPSLADAFFKRGVYDYIGTGWPVKEQPAVAFARAFYEALFKRRPGQAGGETIGEAMLAARKALHKEVPRFGHVWGAYQHYGDPTRTVQVTR